MRIIWGEIKKIWNWKILAIIGVVCAMYYIMFMSYYVDYYRVGNHPGAEAVHYAEEMTRRYGEAITPEQFADFIETERALRIAEAEEYIRTMPVFAEAGIYSYDDYEALRVSVLESESVVSDDGVVGADGMSIIQTFTNSEAYWTLYRAETEMVGYKLAALELLEEIFDWSLTVTDHPESFYHALSEKEQNRFDEHIANGEHRSILNGMTYFYTESYTVSFAIILIFCVLALVSPLLTTDRHANLHYLQYSSKHGRKIMRGQLVATLLSAFALTTVLILIFGGIFSQNGTYLFWNNYVSSDFNAGTPTVFALTYGEWVMSAVALLYALALGASAFAFILSRFSRNMITLVMKLIPAFALLAFLCAKVFTNLFDMGNDLYWLVGIFGTEAYICAAVVVVALVAAWFVMRREKRADVA